MWVIDQVLGQDGWIFGQVRFLRVYGSRRSQLRSINPQKRTRPISSHLDQTSLVNKGFTRWLLGKFFLWDTAEQVVLSGQDNSILPAWVTNHSVWFGSSFPLTELAIIISLFHQHVKSFVACHISVVCRFRELLSISMMTVVMLWLGWTKKLITQLSLKDGRCMPRAHL